MRSKVLSQCNLVCFNQTWPEDTEVLSRVVFSGLLDFAPLIQEVERDGGYVWQDVTETSRSVQASASEAQAHGSQQSETNGTQESETNGTQQSESHGTQNSPGRLCTLDRSPKPMPNSQLRRSARRSRRSATRFARQ